ncbi:MAG: hypothetical protein A2W31_07445 [Planctomycetes bacterium RBG_16_64_10]|nr:MAG: hypothetical protein A2W31_07445 [Planctomycetes bacterium RBG_16_64_10]
MPFRLPAIGFAWALAWCLQVPAAEDGAALRLVPFPKEVRLRAGTFLLRQDLTLEAPAAVASQLAELIGADLQHAALPIPQVRPGAENRLVLRASAQQEVPVTAVESPADLTEEGYVLEITPQAVVAAAPGPAGVFYAGQTLAQVIRANRRGDGLPCLAVKDWPALRWRSFQDDLTRGPSSTLATLKFELTEGARLKMNVFTYYMEYQYAFKKHPVIGPANGSLTPETLTELVRHGKQYHVEILGNQQSFGHFALILRHAQYAGLGETPSLLCPVQEATYQLLDDLYSEVCPLLPFPYFNVCCDETAGLGTGPSKKLAEKIGVGGVYVSHIRRIHDLLERQYNKRMMMWGDIILQHPDHLPQIPKDTIMLTWGYDDRPTFEQQIVPFAESGLEFLVCPGVSNWSRILPDFGTASANIRHFVRDGAKHGALGMLNTAWDDDGEALNTTQWHGYAWGAECAWNAGTTAPEQFNRRVGAVLFGEPADQFGQAIELLAQTHRLAGMQGMQNARFWRHDFPPPEEPAAARNAARQLLAIVRPAIDHLQQCQAQAIVNRDLLDGFLLGAQRMELIGQRMLDGLQAAQLYTQACQQSSTDRAAALLTEAAALVTKNRQAHELLGHRFEQLWLRESQPYALDWTMRRYHEMVKRYDDLSGRLADAQRALQAGQPLPPPEQVGLALAGGSGAP